MIHPEKFRNDIIMVIAGFIIAVISVIVIPDGLFQFIGTFIGAFLIITPLINR